MKAQFRLGYQRLPLFPVCRSSDHLNQLPFMSPKQLISYRHPMMMLTGYVSGDQKLHNSPPSCDTTDFKLGP